MKEKDFGKLTERHLSLKESYILASNLKSVEINKKIIDESGFGILEVLFFIVAPAIILFVGLLS